MDMSRTSGWSRQGSRGRFRYLDASGNRITDEDKLDRIRALAIPPAWKSVWISPRASSKIQATGVDSVGRKQYLYHPAYREQQDQAKFEKLIRFGERLPQLRAATAEHLAGETLDRRRVSALATRLINRGWFRVGTERYAKESRTFGITTLRKRHARVRGSRISFEFVGKNRSVVRSTLVDADLASAVRELLELPGGPRLFRYECDGGFCNLTGSRLNDYVREWMGDEFTVKDFRTWGGTLVAAVEFAERAPAQTDAEAKRTIAAVMRRVAEELGNTPAVARSSYVSPAVIGQYLGGTTLEDFRPRHLRVVRAREPGLDPEEQALLSLLRSWRIKQGRLAA